jgi:hypothetical protein
MAGDIRMRSLCRLEGGYATGSSTITGISRGAAAFMSPKTVETHVGNLFAKLGLLPAAEDHRRVLAVLTYLRR